jgi:hypothetical protein
MISDFYNIENSTKEQTIQPKFVNKNIAYVEDQNTNYSTQQIKFDISSLYNQSKYLNPKEAVLMIPLVAVLSVNDGSINNVANKGLESENGYCMGFKSGYYNLVSSMQIIFDNQTVQQNTQNLNYMVNFNKITKINKDKMNKDCYSNGFIPDKSHSWEYKTVSTANGNGLINNDPVFVVDDLKQKIRLNNFNKSYLKRMYKTAFKPETELITEDEISSEMKSFCKTTNDYHVIYDIAHIKLSDLSSFFDNLPLTKSFNCSITIDLNLGSLKMNYGATVATRILGVLSLSSNDIDFRRGCCPLMVSPVGKGLNFKEANTIKEVVLGLHVVKVLSTKGAVSQHNLNISEHRMAKCRIYIPMIQMDEDIDDKYESLMRTKQIYFNDFNYHTLLKVSGGSDINFSLANTLSNIKGVLIIPFLSSDDNGKCTAVVGVSPIESLASTVGFSPVLSPFTTEPSTTSPLMKLSNYNIQLAGENIYPQNVNYGFQMYQNEISSLNALYGNQDDKLTSGLINQEDWDNNYRYYYTDLSRKLQDNQMKSIQIIGRNATLKTMDLHIYLIYSKQGFLDCLTGKLSM